MAESSVQSICEVNVNKGKQFFITMKIQVSFLCDNTPVKI